MSVFIPPRELRALAAAGAAMLIGTLILQQFPALELSLFAAGAARLTGFLTGMPVGRRRGLVAHEFIQRDRGDRSVQRYGLLPDGRGALDVAARPPRPNRVRSVASRPFRRAPAHAFYQRPAYRRRDRCTSLVGGAVARNLRCLFAPVFWGRRFFTRIDRTQSSPRNVWTHPHSQINRLS